MSLPYDTPEEANLAFNLRELQEQKLTFEAKLNLLRDNTSHTPEHLQNFEILGRRLFHLGGVMALVSAREVERRQAIEDGNKAGHDNREEVESDLRISSKLLVMLEAWSVELADLKVNLKVYGGGSRGTVKPAATPMDISSSSESALQQISLHANDTEEERPAKRRKL